jgi:general secretion pathway protein M
MKKFDWSSLNSRERRLVSIGAGVAALLLILAVLIPLQKSITQARQRVADKQADLAWMRAVAPQLASSRGSSDSAADSDESLLAVVDRAARESGLNQSLSSSEPSASGGLQVRLENASFSILIGWLARLAERHGVRIESANIDKTAEPGLVNASIVLQK